MSKFTEEIKSLLNLHPKGSHFCAVSKESGFALNAEDLIEHINIYDELRNLLDHQTKNLDNFYPFSLAKSDIEDGLDPTFYRTLSKKGDTSLIDAHNKIKKFLKES